MLHNFSITTDSVLEIEMALEHSLRSRLEQFLSATSIDSPISSYYFDCLVSLQCANFEIQRLNTSTSSYLDFKNWFDRFYSIKCYLKK